MRILTVTLVSGLLAAATLGSCGGRQALYENPPPTPETGGTSGTSVAGTSGTSVAGTSGRISALPSCVASITFADGSTHGLAPGPHNRVFFEPLLVDAAPTVNYAMQTVFARPTLSMPADFAIAPASVKADPSSGVELDPWLAELALLPTGCSPASLLGHTVTVRLLWRLDGAIGNVPGHGVYLGTYLQGAPVAYTDARVTTTRTLNTLTPITLTRQFTDSADGIEGVFFRAYLLGGDGDTPTTIHVDSITWQ
jgi:hypothetical protein